MAAAACAFLTVFLFFIFVKLLSLLFRIIYIRPFSSAGGSGHDGPPDGLDDHRVQDSDDQVDGERGRQQCGSRRMAGAESQHGRQGPQKADGYLRTGTVSPLYGGRMFAYNRKRTKNILNILLIIVSVRIY